MSDNKPEIQNEEVDLGQLFNAIGKLFERFFAFLGRILKSLFDLLIYCLKPIVKHIKLISLVVVSAAIAGYVFERFKTPVYESEMLVRPYFESKYQLHNNVNYFNALIGAGNMTELEAIFEMDSSHLGGLVGFEMAVGPETPTELLKAYNDYIASVDTSLVEVNVPYDKFIENRTLLDANIFSIIAKAKENNVFRGLEKGFAKTFENAHSMRLRERRDDTIKLRRASLEKQLEEIKKLQDVYVKVIEKEADNPEVSIGPEGMFPLQQAKRETKEFDLLQREIQIRTTISKLDEQLAKDNSYFDIVAPFDELGVKSGGLKYNNLLLFPLLALGFLVAAFILTRVFNFINNYGE